LSALRTGSWDKYYTVMLCEAVVACCIVKTALKFETFLKPNCSCTLCLKKHPRCF